MVLVPEQDTTTGTTTSTTTPSQQEVELGCLPKNTGRKIKDKVKAVQCVVHAVQVVPKAAVPISKATMKLFHQFLPYHPAKQHPMLLQKKSDSVKSVMNTELTGIISLDKAKQKKLNSKQRKHRRKIHKFLLSDHHDAYTRFCQPIEGAVGASTSVRGLQLKKRGECQCHQVQCQEEMEEQAVPVPEDVTQSADAKDSQEGEDQISVSSSVVPLEQPEENDFCMCHWDYDSDDQEQEEELEDPASTEAAAQEEDPEDSDDTDRTESSSEFDDDHQEMIVGIRALQDDDETRQEEEPELRVLLRVPPINLHTTRQGNATTRPKRRLNLSKRGNWKFLTEKRELQEWKFQKDWVQQDKQALQTKRQTLRTLRRTSKVLRRPMRRGFAEWHAATRNNLIFSIVREDEDEDDEDAAGLDGSFDCLALEELVGDDEEDDENVEEQPADDEQEQAGPREVDVDELDESWM